MASSSVNPLLLPPTAAQSNLLGLPVETLFKSGPKCMIWNGVVSSSGRPWAWIYWMSCVCGVGFRKYKHMRLGSPLVHTETSMSTTCVSLWRFAFRVTQLSRISSVYLTPHPETDVKMVKCSAAFVVCLVLVASVWAQGVWHVLVNLRGPSFKQLFLNL